MSRPSYSRLSPEQTAAKYFMNSIYLKNPELHTGSFSMRTLPYVLERDGTDSGTVYILCSGTVMKSISAFFDTMDSRNISYFLREAPHGEPDISAADDIAADMRERECSCVILIGGGSVLDCGKAAALAAANRCSVKKIMGIRPGLRPSVPIYAVPTTCGTGSEVTPFAVLTDHAKQVKASVTSGKFMPQAVFLDTSLAGGVPHDTAAACAMDALAHGIESYANKYRISSDAVFALKACRMIMQNAETYVNDRSDRRAAAAMMRASYDAGLGFRHTGCGNIHAAAHALGEIYKLPHGLAVAYVMPYVLKEYLYDPAACNDLAVISVKSGCADASEGRLAAAEKLISEICRIQRSIGIAGEPHCVSREDISVLTSHAFSGAGTSGSPVRFSVRMFRELFEKLV